MRRCCRWVGLVGLQLAFCVHPADAKPATAPAAARSSAGPDLVVAELGALQNWGTESGITAYSVKTTVCNVGDAPAAWFLGTSEHPVIPQHLYRLKDGRFEQIGLSWVVHTFYPLNGTVCSAECVPGGSSALGVGCSDIHSMSVNALQANMAPRWQVNAATGVFPYPWNSPPCPPVIGRRLQVHNCDLHPPDNPEALYFVEAQFLTADEAAAGNGDNNVSHRRVQVVWDPANPTVYGLALVPDAETQREKPALLAWKDVDPAVTVVPTDIPFDGRMILAYKVTDAGGGWFHYEYAMYNMNSDRCARAFSIPVPAGVFVANIGFHDVDDHSNSPVSGAEWAATLAEGRLTWTTTAYEIDAYANALRWGTTYNFRFDADVPPRDADVTLTLFKPGTPESVTMPAAGPQGKVNLELRPVTSAALVGETVRIGLYAVSAEVTDQMVRGLQAILQWDAASLQLLGVDNDGPYNWLMSGFFNDSGGDGVNNTYADGNAYYQAAGNFTLPAWAPSAGLLVTTFCFEALAPAATTSVGIEPALGQYTITQVFGNVPGVDVSGSLGSCALRVDWGRLTLEAADDCGAAPGEPVIVYLRVSDLPEPINGVQALIEFDDAALDFVSVQPGDGMGSPWDSATEVFVEVQGGELTYAVLLLADDSAEDAVVARLVLARRPDAGAAVAAAQLRAQALSLITKLTLAAHGTAAVPQLQGPALITQRGDWTGDGQIDLADHAGLVGCLGGPGSAYGPGSCCRLDFDADGDADLADFAELARLIGPP